jgi:hypothetical protein
MQVVGAINAAGYRKVALLTDPRVLADATAGDEKPKAR